jgi:glycosyltransferase involved in cell wall biosynthesis
MGLGKPVAARITLITASMPDRSHLLAEMLASVAAQTVLPAAHLIIIDDRPLVPKVQELLAKTSTDYVVQVDDDDLLYPNHIETLAANLDADVVWTWCDVTGRSWSLNETYQPGVLQSRNYIPSNHARKVSAVMDAGGINEHGSGDYEDWNLLRRLETAGATFKNVPEVTWAYRFGLCKQITG